jgi:leader peptidase (prepilin peptidase)/N-methyltransferase
MSALPLTAILASPLAGVLVWALAVRHLALEPEADEARIRSAADLAPLVVWARRLRAGGPIGREAMRRAAAELGAVLIAVWAAASLEPAWVWPGCALGWLLLAAAIVDARERILPDEINAGIFVLGLAAALPLGGAEIVSRLIGALAGFGVLAGFGWLYARLRGRDGLGLGDAKLLGALGAWVGWPGLASVVLIAAGAGIGSILLGAVVTRKSPRGDQSLALGPYLALGGWLTWLYGPVGLAGSP